GQYRIAAADAWFAVKDVAEAFGQRHLFEGRAWIGDRNKTLSCLGSTDHLVGALVKVIFEDIGFERAAGFARHKEERPCEIDIGFEPMDLRRLRRGEDMESTVAGFCAEGLLQDFRAAAPTQL